MRVVPGWLRSYQRAWLGSDLVAGLIIWSVVTPQALAYCADRGAAAAGGPRGGARGAAGLCPPGQLANAGGERDDGNRAVERTRSEGWTLISVKDDWESVFADA